MFEPTRCMEIEPDSKKKFPVARDSPKNRSVTFQNMFNFISIWNLIWYLLAFGLLHQTPIFANIVIPEIDQ